MFCPPNVLQVCTRVVNIIILLLHVNAFKWRRFSCNQVVIKNIQLNELSHFEIKHDN